MQVGDAVVDFKLPDTEGNEHGPEGTTVVVFTCNHCPYALAWHERILDVARDYSDRGVRVLLVNPNDAERYPGDSYEAMKERVAADGGWSAPHPRDESQEVAREYGAQTTPDVFVLDSDLELRYRGAPDADHRDPSLNAEWLREALDAVLADPDPPPAATPP